MSKKLEGAGLRGQVAGQTSLSTVGKEGHGLTYRGYAIEDLADNAKFEEVAFLLLYGHLPNKSELSEYQQKLISNRELPEELRKNSRAYSSLSTSDGCYENGMFCFRKFGA